MITTRLNRAQKAEALGVNIEGTFERSMPLGSIDQVEEGGWRWTLTRTEDGMEHRLSLMAQDATAFGVWLHSGEHGKLIRSNPLRMLPNTSEITTSEWVRIAKSACDEDAEGIVSITYHAQDRRNRNARTRSRWVNVNEAARVFGVSIETVRRRIREGKLPSRRKLIRGGGFCYEVDMSTASMQAEMPIARPSVQPLIAPCLPGVKSAEPTPAVVAAPATVASAAVDPTVDIIMTLFQRLDVERQANTIKHLMALWTIEQR